MAKRLSFQDFVDEYGGPKKISQALGVTDRVVYEYYNKKLCPSAHVMFKLVSLSLGRLDYNAIVHSCYPLLNGKEL